MQTPIDFTLRTDEDQPLAFDRGYRADRNVVLGFFRGHW